MDRSVPVHDEWPRIDRSHLRCSGSAAEPVRTIEDRKFSDAQRSFAFLSLVANNWKVGMSPRELVETVGQKQWEKYLRLKKPGPLAGYAPISCRARDLWTIYTCWSVKETSLGVVIACIEDSGGGTKEFQDCGRLKEFTICYPVMAYEKHTAGGIYAPF